MNKPINTLAVLSMLAGVLAGMPGAATAEENTMPRAGMMQDAKEGVMGCPGYGTMGGTGYGMGMGAMGGMGPGMGMMGGFGPGMGGGMGGFGPGMMGMGPMAMLDLSDAQTAQVQKIQAEFMKAQRPLMRRIWDEKKQLWNLTKTEKPDPAAVGKAYGRLADLQRQALEAHIDAENKMAAVLTKEQQSQMRRGFGRSMWGN
ncbi:MAG TPA: Spy/CpxP family protein refolding chaperone [Thiobacillus sp.]|jgi:Spy/CpxP family protein refolding chaperone|nr:Spy/CpxP family protein refolding chaperone [Thiobacillus sp.]